jgi:hypothetical protein
MLSWWEPSAGAKKRRKESKWRRKWADKRPGHCCDGAPPLFIFTRHQQLNLLITAKALFFLLQSTINCVRARFWDSFDIMSKAAVAVSPITCDWDYSPRDPLLSTIKGKKKVAVYYYRCVKMKSFCYCEMSDFVRARPWVSACAKCAPRVLCLYFTWFSLWYRTILQLLSERVHTHKTLLCHQRDLQKIGNVIFARLSFAFRFRFVNATIVSISVICTKNAESDSNNCVTLASWSWLGIFSSHRNTWTLGLMQYKVSMI